MERLLTPEFWQQYGQFVMTNWFIMVPLLLLAGVITWWLRGHLAKSEIAGLKAESGALRERLELAQAKEANEIGPAIAQLQKETADLKRQVAELQQKRPSEDLGPLEVTIESSATSVLGLAFANNDLKKLLSLPPKHEKKED